MRPLFLIPLILFSACKYDKEAHLAGGLALSEAVRHHTGSAIQGCIASIGLGLLKEALDAGGHGVVDGQDVVATAVGCHVRYEF